MNLWCRTFRTLGQRSAPTHLAVIPTSSVPDRPVYCLSRFCSAATRPLPTAPPNCRPEAVSGCDFPFGQGESLYFIMRNTHALLRVKRALRLQTQIARDTRKDLGRGPRSTETQGYAERTSMLSLLAVYSRVKIPTWNEMRDLDLHRQPLVKSTFSARCKNRKERRKSQVRRRRVWRRVWLEKYLLQLWH